MVKALSEGSSYPAVSRRVLSPYDKITQAIMSGEFPPGQTLTETALADWCQVSRTPIREALTRLEQDGLVVRGDRGLMVRARSPEEILDIYETRIVLEGMAARVAALRRSPMDLIAMRRAAEQMEEVDTSDEVAMAEANREFHRAIWRACRNESLSDLLSRLNLHLSRYPATTLTQPGRWEAAIREHREIIEAIAAQDANQADHLTTAHFTAARDLRLDLWAHGKE